jgi:hypothetical protein
VTIEWELEPVAGGEKVYINGTVEQVHAELAITHPNWEQDFVPKEDLVKRTDFPYNDVVCAHWPAAPNGAITNGVNYLRTVPGKPRNGPGPGNCGRVSCGRVGSDVTDKSRGAIWWCNDVSIFAPLISLVFCGKETDKVKRSDRTKSLLALALLQMELLRL